MQGAIEVVAIARSAAIASSAGARGTKYSLCSSSPTLGIGRQPEVRQPVPPRSGHAALPVFFVVDADLGDADPAAGGAAPKRSSGGPLLPRLHEHPLDRVAASG